jgi:pimeloyl-ACP methyl ester carboxylesterase
VIETGAGSLALTWEALADRLTEFTQVVRYDRAGLGWSEHDHRWRRTGDDVADDLHALLRRAGVNGPFVLLGHSAGGLYVRAFAARFPDEVAGLVLVDATHEDLMARARDQFGAAAVALRLASLLGYAAIPRGLVRMGIALGPLRGFAGRMFGGNSDADQRLRTALWLQSAFRWASLAETLGMPVTMQAVKAGRRQLSVPVAVITRADTSPDDDSLFARFAETWAELQADLATLSTNAVHVTATTAGHDVHVDEPDLVVDAVQRVVDAAHDQS